MLAIAFVVGAAVAAAAAGGTVAAVDRADKAEGVRAYGVWLVALRRSSDLWLSPFLVSLTVAGGVVYM